MNNKKLIWFLVFWLQLPLIRSQSLDELKSILLDSNHELKALSQAYYAQLEKAPQVSQMPDPEFGLGLSILPVETRLGPQIARVGGTQMIPWKGLLSQSKELEIAKAIPVLEQKEALSLNLVFALERAYYSLYEIEQSQSLMGQYLEIMQGIERLALSKVESGKASTADVLRAQLSIESLRQELAILEQDKIAPLATINQLLDRKLSSPVNIVDSLHFAMIPFNKNQLFEQVRTSHPLLRMYASQQEIAQANIDLNILQSKPSIGVGLDYILVNQRDIEDLTRNGRDALQLRASVKVPLNKEKYRAKEREEELKITVLDHKISAAVNQFLAIIESSYAQYETARLQIELYEKQKEITRSVLRVLETEYSAKGTGFDELLEVEQNLIEYELKIIKAIIQSHIAKSSIERFVNY